MNRTLQFSGTVFALLVGLSIASVTCPVLSTAAEPARSKVTESQQRSSQSVTLDDARLGKDWDLKAEEWARYRQLMEGPLGVYSPNLDPLTALGIESRSDEERRRYAELQVRMEGRRIEKLMIYQRAYQDAWKRLYPNLRPINAPSSFDADALGASPRNKHSMRVAVFIKDNCAPCDHRVQQLQAAGQPFDIYVVGSRQDDEHIRKWAGQVGIDPERVREGTITLNHDAGRWLSIGGRGALPAVMREVDGRWLRD